MSHQSLKNSQIHHQSSGFDEMSTELGRAFTVYFLWLSVGLLAQPDDPKNSKPVPGESNTKTQEKCDLT